MGEMEKSLRAILKATKQQTKLRTTYAETENFQDRTNIAIYESVCEQKKREAKRKANIAKKIRPAENVFVVRAQSAEGKRT